jgi:hypothetical protein
MALTDILRSDTSHPELQELLNRPPTVLLGVSTAAGAARAATGVKTVFDLGSSWLFANVRSASRAAMVGTSTARFGVAPSDWLEDTASWSSLEEIASAPLEKLRRVDAPQAAALKAALDIVSIRDFAFWPPHGVARGLVNDAVGGTVDPDQLQTEALRPRFGGFPTERVNYGTLVMLQMQFEGERAPLNKTISLKSAFSQSPDSLGQRSAHTRRSPSRGPRRTSPSTTCCRRLSFHEAIR